MVFDGKEDDAWPSHEVQNQVVIGDELTNIIVFVQTLFFRRSPRLWACVEWMERSRNALPNRWKRQTFGTISSTNRSKNFAKSEAPSSPRKFSISSRFAEKFSVKSGRLPAMLRLELREAECLPSL